MRKPGYMTYFTNCCFYCFVAFFSSVKRLHDRIFCPWMSFHISPLLQRNILFSLFKKPSQALYETLRKTFLALSKPKLFPCTHSSEQSKSWHYTSGTCPCMLVGVHLCNVSEFDPNGVFVVKTIKYPENTGNLWNIILMPNQLHSAFRCS